MASQCEREGVVEVHIVVQSYDQQQSHGEIKKLSCYHPFLFLLRLELESEIGDHYQLAQLPR